MLLDAFAVAVVVSEVVRYVSSGDLSSLPALALGAAMVSLRRRIPITAASLSVLTSAIALLTPADAVPIWALAEVCLFSLPLRSTPRAAIAVGAVHAGILYLGALAALQLQPFDAIALILPLWTVAVLALGFAVRRHREYLAALAQRAEEAAEARSARMLLRADEERLDIARDLHDSVGNALAVIKMHADAADRHLDADPERARVELKSVRSTSVRVLSELGGILTVLRRREVGREIDRLLPSVQSIEVLILSLRETGMKVSAEVELPRYLDPAVDAAVFRTVQEGLTNARKHGLGSVELSVKPGSTHGITVMMLNATRSSMSASSGGFGLVGMRERVLNAGGTLDVSDSGGVFRVVADFPTGTAGEQEL
ncbi:sensor histidine kinase [Pseudoclavibacter terrae]|nr:histidine kinase [Pseudoclavibacter terrae]